MDGEPMTSPPPRAVETRALPARTWPAALISPADAGAARARTRRRRVLDGPYAGLPSPAHRQPEPDVVPGRRNVVRGVAHCRLEADVERTGARSRELPVRADSEAMCRTFRFRRLAPYFLDTELEGETSQHPLHEPQADTQLAAAVRHPQPQLGGGCPAILQNPKAIAEFEIQPPAP